MVAESVEGLDRQTKQVRERFSLLLKELYTQRTDELSMLQFYDSLEHIRQESVSRISSGKQALKDLMIVELLQLNPDISLDWLFTGEGTMFKSHMQAYDARITTLETQVSDLTTLLKETLELSRQDLKNRGLL